MIQSEGVRDSGRQSFALTNENVNVVESLLAELR